MEEIKAGEYIRTKDGVIAKVTYVDVMMVDCDRDVFDLNNLAMMEIPTEYIEEYIVKHSSNLIDIIEVGDIIQLKGAEKLKYEVLKISWSKSKGKHIHIINPFRTEGGKDIFVEDIDSILTKEQFEKKKYIVGDESNEM